jgi:hypothetical protein
VLTGISQTDSHGMLKFRMEIMEHLRFCVIYSSQNTWAQTDSKLELVQLDAELESVISLYENDVSRVTFSVYD